MNPYLLASLKSTYYLVVVDDSPQAKCESDKSRVLAKLGAWRLLHRCICIVVCKKLAEALVAHTIDSTIAAVALSKIKCLLLCTTARESAISCRWPNKFLPPLSTIVSSPIFDPASPTPQTSSICAIDILRHVVRSGWSSDESRPT